MSASTNERNFSQILQARLSSLSPRLNDLGIKKPLCRHSLKQLDNGLKDSLDILNSECHRAPESRQRDFTKFFADFEIFLTRCETLVERLEGRNALLALIYLVPDCITIKRCLEEVKQKRAELPGRISRLKEHWEHHVCSSLSNQLPTGSTTREHSQSEVLSSNPPHTSIPSSSQSLAMASPHSFSNASVHSIQRSQFNSAANNMNATHNYPPSIVNNGGSVVLHIHYGSGHDSITGGI
ncbi:hypothetical protein GYMLUDRAFT_243729 [Collybiopsis luxurians FD-317 M1]|uniref:Uncharacterized protein n=1 Tax=Collybiopsis luxurians FD-317 M1 TaxID=944289 RepID=A0A0D0CQ19_9AGAR|nr:hypothetical protein GYMLUDRAFT_243729 [Collybiopsis luxurians FD-317 M1]